MTTGKMSLMPEKCAARVSPPTLVLFYKDTNTGKRRRRSMPLRKFALDVDVQQYAKKLWSDTKNGQYIKLIPLQQLESVLSKIKKARLKDDKPLSKLEPPLDLLSKKGKLQPLACCTARSNEDDLMVDKLLKKSDEGNRLKPNVVTDTGLNINIDRDSIKLSPDHPRVFNGAIENQRTLIEPLLKKQNDPPTGLDGDKASDSLQLSTATVPSEISEGDEDFENMTEEGILEKLIALPSHSDDENDLNKVSDEILNQKKKEMDKEFEQNQLKPGDDGYEYDREIDFDADDKVSCGWDSSNSDEEYF